MKSNNKKSQLDSWLGKREGMGCAPCGAENTKALWTDPKGLNNVAATYSPGCNPSTIGAAGLNFS
ncbi:hypothetical protein JYB62_10800, partial [Algoriphagus lutimaris]|uniref:hypothetical protein n=1 Tax=Algoriphagus lutimaris TaxID=613197 RepID=UPI00196AE133